MDLWDAVQAKLTEKAPPRNHPTNGEEDGLLKGLLRDPHSRPMVPTFTCKGTRRYRYYETRRDLALANHAEATRFAMHQLDRHIVENLQQLLADEHALRRLSGVTDGAGSSEHIREGLRLGHRTSTAAADPEAACEFHNGGDRPNRFAAQSRGAWD